MVNTVIAEIIVALKRLYREGESYTIFINKMGLTQAQREEIYDYLGQGSVTVKIENTAEPAEWRESAIAGVWFGVFYAFNGNPMLETIEVNFFPAIATAQQEDIDTGLKRLESLLNS